MGSYLKVDRSRKVTRVCRYVDGNDPVKTVNLMVQESEQKIARLGKPGDLGHKGGGWFRMKAQRAHSFDPHFNPRDKYSASSYFTDEKTEAQKVKINNP